MLYEPLKAARYCYLIACVIQHLGNCVTSDGFATLHEKEAMRFVFNECTAIENISTIFLIGGSHVLPVHLMMTLLRYRSRTLTVARSTTRNERGNGKSMLPLIIFLENFN